MIKSNRTILLVTALILVVIGTTAVLVLAVNNKDDAHGADAHHSEKVSCKISGQKLSVNISSDKMVPEKTVGKLCDTLTITNSDSQTRLIAFGHHDSHKEYDGVTEKILKQGQSFTVSLNEKGTFTIHDHYKDEVEGSFTVN